MSASRAPRRGPRRSRLFRGSLALLLAGGLAAVMAPSADARTAAPTGSAPVTTALPPNEQAYVVDTPVDPYNSDPSSIHVAVTGGREEARSFVRFALNYLPPGSQITAMTATFHLTVSSGASNTSVFQDYQVNTTKAIIEACALVSPLPATVTPADAPAYDCPHASSNGVQDKAGDAWTFNLRDLTPYWARHGNTGFALVPLANAGTDTWSVSYYVSQTVSSVTYLPPAPAVASSPPAPPTAAASTLTPSVSAPVSSAVLPAPVTSLAASTPPPTTAASPTVAATTPAPASSSAVAAAPPTGNRPRSHRNAGWLWAALAALLVLVAGFGYVERVRLLALGTRFGPPSIAAVRRHPRTFTVVTAATAWSLVFAAYSLNQGSTPVVSVAGGGGNGSNSGSGAGTLGTGATPNTSAGAHTGGPSASSSAGAVPGTSVGTGSGTVGNGGGTGPVSGPTALPSANEFSGAGTYRTIDGVQVFFPSDGSAPVAKMYTGSDDTIGYTANQINLCAHAALTYGSAFNISASDLNVYWDYVNAKGGVFGRKINATYQNDNYDPGTAVQAAQACKDANTFFLLGGIGFDQIPAVRAWAEQNHELYLHHIATTEGSVGLHYSFTSLPSVEQMGTWFGQLALEKFRGQKVGVMWRDSPNWQPGRDNFESMLRAAGMTVVDYPVQINQGNYTQDLVEMKAAHVTVVFAWENALATTEMIEQAEGQKYLPSWLVFPFNLELKTLGNANSLAQPIYGVAAWDPYTNGWSDGPYSGYSASIAEFNREYAQYDPGAKLNGDGGDLLFLNWEADRGLDQLLQLCGSSCTRNKIAGILLAGYSGTVPPNCAVDFSGGDHHHGGYLMDVDQVVKDPSGSAAWIPLQRCASQVG